MKPRGRATRTMPIKVLPLATFHLERSALNCLELSNCEVAGARR